MDKPDQRSTPEWLKRVQENSWEPEILLSGLVLIGLLQLPAMIRRASEFYRAETLSGNLLGVFTALEQIVYVLVFGLVVHLFLRSVWVGLIGLTYTFPKGIKPESLGYHKKFEDKVRQLPDTESQIILLEKVCSSIFATCFFLMMVIFGANVGVSFLVIFLFILDSFLGLFGFKVFSLITPYIDTFLSIVFLVFLFGFHQSGAVQKKQVLGKGLLSDSQICGLDHFVQILPWDLLYLCKQHQKRVPHRILRAVFGFRIVWPAKATKKAGRPVGEFVTIVLVWYGGELF
jgi:hypothetical protein